MIYFDNSATTNLCRTARDEIINCIDNNWGNPSSLHEKGLEAEMLLEDARKATAELLGAGKDEIFFTSGGTQSNNIAISGSAKARKNLGKKVITTSIEHPSVSKCFDELEKEGFEVIRLGVEKKGNVSLDELEKALDENVILVSMMLVNNELGTILPVSDAVSLVKRKAKNAVFHSDLVQAFGKLDLSVKDLGVDFASMSGHKIHGPKGAGALYIKKGTKIKSPVFGGGQENGIRSGTEPMPAIAGFLGALKEIDINNSYKKVSEIKDRLERGLRNTDGTVINSSEGSIPYILNFSLPGYPSETMLNFLSSNDIYVSSGSACAKGKESSVLKAAGFESELINSSLRLSFSKYNTTEECDIFLETLKKGMKVIRKK